MRAKERQLPSLPAAGRAPCFVADSQTPGDPVSASQAGGTMFCLEASYQESPDLNLDVSYQESCPVLYWWSSEASFPSPLLLALQSTM